MKNNKNIEMRASKLPNPKIRNLLHNYLTRDNYHMAQKLIEKTIGMRQGIISKHLWLEASTETKPAETEYNFKRNDHWRKNSYQQKKGGYSRVSELRTSQDLMHCLNYNFNNDSSHDVTFPGDFGDSGDSVEPTPQPSCLMMRLELSCMHE